MAEFLFVGAGGFLGAMLRYAVNLISNNLSSTPNLPFATPIVNVLGCLAIGALSTHGSLTEQQRLFLIPGLLGGFTTFSAFGLETMTLWQTSGPLAAAVNVLANVGLGLLAVAVGRAVSAGLFLN